MISLLERSWLKGPRNPSSTPLAGKLRWKLRFNCYCFVAPGMIFDLNWPDQCNSAIHLLNYFDCSDRCCLMVHRNLDWQQLGSGLQYYIHHCYGVSMQAFWLNLSGDGMRMVS
jgi:hypothetical protein